jgi:hypothetical protein
MNIYNIVNSHPPTELFLGMFGPEVEIENQFKKNVKDLDVYLFYVDAEGITDEGVPIACPMDKKTQIIPFDAIRKIKDLETGGILEVDQYAPVDKTEITTHFITGGESLELYNKDLLARIYDEVNIKDGIVTLKDTEGDVINVDELFNRIATLKFG